MYLFDDAISKRNVTDRLHVSKERNSKLCCTCEDRVSYTHQQPKEYHNTKSHSDRISWIFLILRSQALLTIIVIRLLRSMEKTRG